MQCVNIANQFSIGGDDRFVLIAGPCAIENEAMAMETAVTLKEIEMWPNVLKCGFM